MLRRVLLGLVTALLVARPLVPGDDPGRTQLGTGVAGLGLVLLWLLAATGWAVWRAWSREGAWRGSLIEVGLLVLVGVSFFSADQPGRYWYPGWLISWEWVGTFAAFCLVRQLFRGEEENDGLLAALLATGVALAATGLIQALTLSSPAPQNIDATVAQMFGIQETPASNPGILIGFLILLLPAIIVASVVCFRAARAGWQPKLIAACGIIAVVAIGFAFARQANESLNARLDAWSTTSVMIREHPWFGVGPGNFSREYPAFLTSAAQEKIAEPPSFLLEIAANYGLIGLAALVTTIALFFWRVLPALKTSEEPASRGSKPPEETPGDSTESPEADAPASPGPPPRTNAPRTNWEFYLGGMAGLTLGFMIRFNPTGGWQALAVEATAALIRFVLWFGVFALLERVPWTNRSRVAATSMGVAALLVFLLFNRGFGYPSLAVPLWVMVALALNATPSPMYPPRHWLGLILPAPILAVVSLLFLAAVYYPAASAAGTVAEVRRNYPSWREKVEPRLMHQRENATSPADSLTATRSADRILKEFILEPLERARDLERANAAICTELAYWYAKEWQLYAALKEFENNNVLKAVRLRQRKAGDQAIGAAGGNYQPGSTARGVQELDPDGPEGWWVMYQVRTMFAEGAEKPNDQSAQFRMAANNLKELVKRDPTEPRWRFLFAETLFRTGQKEDDAEAKEQLLKALELDAEAGEGPRRLSDDQRAKLRVLLGKGGFD